MKGNGGEAREMGEVRRCRPLVHEKEMDDVEMQDSR